MLLTSHHNHRCVRPRLGVAVSDAARARTDPTGTAPIASRWDAEFARRFARVKRVLHEVIVTRDTLGISDDLKKRVDASVGGATRAQRAARALDLVRSSVHSEILGSPGYAGSWQNKFVAMAVTKGVTDAYRRMKQAGMDVTLELTVDVGIGQSAQRRADFIAQQSYDLLEGIDADMAAQMQDIIQQGLLDGKSPQQIARELDQELDIGRTRARTIARTETIGAHADATLDSYEEGGIEGVQAEVEFATAGDDNVCPQCQALEGSTYTIEDARGVIPVHPNCRCAWLPVISSTADADWSEEDHPRDPHGRFAGVSTFIGEDPYSNSLGINGALRAREALLPEQQKIVDEVDAAIKAAPPLERAETWYRGADEDVYPPRSKRDPYTVRDPAFTSVSTDFNVAEEFATQTSDSGFVYAIDVPRGTRALATAPFQVEGMQYQNERLLPRNALFERVGRPEKRGELTVVRLRYVTLEAKDTDWDESKHPRGDRGRFAHGAGELSTEERDSVFKYAGRYYAQLNRNLRLGLPLSEVHDGVRQGLDSLLQRSTLHTDTTLYRGIGDPEKVPAFAFPLDTTFGQLKEGDVVENLGFVSTTHEPRTAYLFSNSTGGLLEISAPAGTHAFDVGALSEAEPEILLPRGTKLRYTGRGESPEPSRNLPRTYKFEVVASSVRDWSPFQPRVPKGQAGGGQWSGENLTKAERAEVRYYTGAGYEHVNSTLRQGEAGMLDRLHLLDSAVAKSVIDKSITTYRGVNSAEFTEKLDSLQPGETITDRAFTSTSGSFLSAAMYGGVGSPTMEIRIPSGSSVLYAESMSANSGIGEEEYILPRDSTFKYSGSRTVGGGAGASKGSKVYTFDLVPRVVKDYDPSQERVPAGQHGGGQWRGENLSKSERDAVFDYTADDFLYINETLRSGELDVMHPDYKHKVSLLDSALAKSVLPSDTVVYRGVGFNEFEDQLKYLKPGEIVIDPAFISTSDSLVTAAKFSGGPATVMEVRLPAGSNALYVEDFSANKGNEENEYVLPRGTKLHYVTSRTTKSGTKVYSFDLQPRSVSDWNPFQPRVPAGQHGGGEWTEGTSGTATGSLVGGNPKRGFDPKHVDALKQYAASIYQPVNEGLRNKTKLRTQEEQVVLALDEAFERNQRTTEVMQLFRAAGEEFAAYVDALKVGDNLIDEGFASTTTDERLARSFLSGQPGEKKVMVEIVLPKDSKAIDTSPFNPFKGENEVLLPRNTTFKYLGMERDVYRFRANPR